MANTPINRANQVGSGFTNLQRILQANKANKLGSTIGSGIQKAGEQASSAMNTAQQKFNEGVSEEKDRLKNAEQNVNSVLGNVTNASASDISNFEKYRSGKTEGPTEIANANELAAKAQYAQNLGQATGSDAGRYGLLNKYVGAGKQYTGGQQRLDNLLLGQTGANDLRQARRGTFGVVNQQKNLVNAAQQQGQQLQNQAKTLATNTIDKLGKNVIDYDTSMQEAANKAADARRAYVDQARKDAEEGYAADDELYGKLGINEGTAIWDADLGQFVKENDLAATRQNIQTMDDFRKIQALKKLSGNSLTGKSSAALAGYGNEADVNAFKNAGNFADINKDTVSQYLGNQSAAARKELADRAEIALGRGYSLRNNGAMDDKANTLRNVNEMLSSYDPEQASAYLNRVTNQDAIKAELQAKANEKTKAFNDLTSSTANMSQQDALAKYTDYLKSNGIDFRPDSSDGGLDALQQARNAANSIAAQAQQKANYIDQKREETDKYLNDVKNIMQHVKFGRTFKKKTT